MIGFSTITGASRLAGVGERRTAGRRAHRGWPIAACTIAFALAALGGVFFIFDRMVGDPVIATMISALAAVTAAPLAVNRPAGRPSK